MFMCDDFVLVGETRPITSCITLLGYREFIADQEYNLCGIWQTNHECVSNRYMVWLIDARAMMIP